MGKVVKKLAITNKLGLHARAAALLVQTVTKFSSQVTFSKDGQCADGRSIMAVLTLAATQGSKNAQLRRLKNYSIAALTKTSKVESPPRIRYTKRIKN
jgi:phosphotransferase system HPr (HPr) family protein